MKKADIAMIILIAATSVFIAFFVAKSIFGSTYTGSAKVKTIDAISSEIVDPDKEIFNKDAINPTVKVNINATDNK